MRYWFQNLKKDDQSKRLFHFRGSVSSNRRQWFRYELSSGRALRLKYQHGETCDSQASSQITIGFLFFTLYLTFELPEWIYFKRKCVATWDNNREFELIEGREYGFYVYEWAFVWSFHSKVYESSSSDPWWMRQYIHLDEIVLGKKEIIKDKLPLIENIKFQIGTQVFNMDQIKWIRYRRFRRFLPYALYHSQDLAVDMKIKNPPMHSGKGENSWDCGDDGTYGLHTGWEHGPVNYSNYRQMAELAVDKYVESVFKTTKRYGGSRGERGISADLPYKYLGTEVS